MPSSQAELSRYGFTDANLMMMRLALRRVAPALLLALFGASYAVAQTPRPQYEDSEPERGETVHRAPRKVTIEFDMPLDSSSKMTVVNECGEETSGATSVSGVEMSAAVSGEWAGKWTVRYKAVGPGGASSTEGSFSYFVHAGPACGASSSGAHHHGSADDSPGAGDHHGNRTSDHPDTHASSDSEHGGDHARGHSLDGGGHAGGHSVNGGDHAAHSAEEGDHAEGTAHSGGSHESHGKNADSGGGAHHGSHGGDSKSAPRADGRSGLLGRSSTEISLAIALLIPVLAGIAGGLTLRRRFAQS
jgi:methionine-rich copper-binding protein CopC